MCTIAKTEKTIAVEIEMGAARVLDTFHLTMPSSLISLADRFELYIFAIISRDLIYVKNYQFIYQEQKCSKGDRKEIVFNRDGIRANDILPPRNI